MTDEEIFIKALETELLHAGHSCRNEGNVLRLLDIGIEMYAREAKFQPMGLDRAASVTFEAKAPGLIAGGVEVFQMGIGETDVEAAGNAAMQWVVGVCPALEKFIARPDHTCGLIKAEMLVSSEETDEQFGWIIHLPPILSRAYGENCSINAPKQNEVFRTIFAAVHPYAAHNNLFWLECFAARYPGKKVDATCRVNNAVWEEGQNALLNWAMSWPDPDPCLLSHRQFMLFEPCAVQHLPSSTTLSKKIDEHQAKHKRPWWKRFGKV